MKHTRIACMGLLLLLAALVPIETPAAGATTPPSGFQATVVANNQIFAPTLMSFTPEGRIVVAQQNGKVKVWSGGGVSTTPYLSLTVESSSDRGILGIAYDPNYAANHYVYVYYHRPTPTIHGVISRFVVRPDGLSADPATETVLYEMDSLNFTGVHTGGSLKFGPDGKLYVSVGDDRRGIDVSHSLASDLGKVLRLNKNGSIPVDNPFYTQAAGKYRSIYSKGHRNPYTFDFDQRGHLMLAEVGLSSYEEINDVVGGRDYGWPDYEGPDGGDVRYVDPVGGYAHDQAPEDGGCAIIGAAAVDPATSTFPASYDGDFFYADYCNGWMKSFDPVTGTSTPFATGIVNPTHVVFGPDGNLYYLTRNSGTGSGWITRITYTGSTAPSISAQPRDATVGVGQAATFTVEAQGAAPLSYQWFRNGTAISGATSASYTLTNAQPSDSGASFRVSVANASGSVTSQPATLTVVTNQAPSATITSPAATLTYLAGQKIDYSATATDPEDGTLPASAFDWEIIFHHDTHTHPFLDPAPGSRSGSFTVPDSGFETAANVWFEMRLQVTDSAGRTTTVSRNVHPRTTTLSLQASPADARPALDGTLVSSNHKVLTVRNMRRIVSAPGPQALIGGSWRFDTWSDRGQNQHEIVPTAGNNWFMAVFRLDAGNVGTGVGLTATYYDDTTLTQPVIQRTDPVVLANVAGNSSPAPGVSPGTWSARWQGSVSAQFSELTTFRVLADDGVRLWIGGNLVIDAWTPASKATLYSSAPITMTAGARVPIRLELRQGSGRNGQVRLLWQSKSMPRSIIPSTQLFPTG
ncbi:PQQ-dependent sugar dehydrogenase [Nocardioides bizhenqiangii]|uniref:PQQ-dependent sugar dehydrogenase n=1 Tax=Nocardioides bizhenqiangii TaxID=3095076 RepID=A0ABZ0ZMC3_9ACTN|nr:PQQ-dependent sugar dehydrogenase [Nocardioides sp. HM61]WQQ24737.1 PQQ-dependent sugar dehydrogenase [Nocardioides sp. HM61]